MALLRRNRNDVSPDGKAITIDYDGSKFIGRFNSTRILKDVGVYHIIQSKENLDEVLFFGDYIGLLVRHVLYSFKTNISLFNVMNN